MKKFVILHNATCVGVYKTLETAEAKYEKYSFENGFINGKREVEGYLMDEIDDLRIMPTEANYLKIIYSYDPDEGGLFIESIEELDEAVPCASHEIELWEDYADYYEVIYDLRKEVQN